MLILQYSSLVLGAVLHYFVLPCLTNEDGRNVTSLGDQLRPQPNVAVPPSCPNYFAEFFHQLAQRNRWTSSTESGTYAGLQEWLSTPFHLSELDALLQGLSRSDENDTQADAAPSPRFECQSALLPPENRSAGVLLVNSSELVRLVARRPNVSVSQNDSTAEANVSSPNSTETSPSSACVIVMFYATSCRFSAATAPEFNAFGRAMNGVDVLAFDINQSNGVNSKYGVVAVPSIVLFHNGKLAARFNDSKRTLENFASFIHNLTGLEVNASVSVLPADFEGPVPSTAVIGPDYFLWFSNAFLAVCGLAMLQQKVGAAVRSKVTAMRDYILQVWRTGEFYEQVGIAEGDEPLPQDRDPVHDGNAPAVADVR